MQNAAATFTPATIATGSKTFAIRYENGTVVDGYRSRAAAVAAYYSDTRAWAVETVRALWNDTEDITVEDYRFMNWAFETFTITMEEVR